MLAGTSNQFGVFLFCLLTGGGLAVIWMILQWFIKLLGNNVVVKFILEFIFSAILILSVFILTVKLNNGILRWYIMLGFLVGFFLIKQFFAILLAICKKIKYNNAIMYKEGSNK